MSFKVTVLEKATTWLVGGDLFDFIREQVETVADMSLTGEQKRERVFNDAKEFFGEVLNVFVNIAIEVAVIALKEKTGSLDGK